MIWRTDYRELGTLRLSLRLVAEAAKARGAPLIIPPAGAERGWNTLCLNLIEWMGDRRVNLDGSAFDERQSDVPPANGARTDAEPQDGDNQRFARTDAATDFP
jgi:hypothetical protein